jgi:hypothetical protein
MKTVSHVAVAALLALLTGCGGGGGDDGGGGGDFVAITSAQPASLVAGAIADASANLVSTGTYNNTVINGLSGTATVSGSKSYSGYQSCGTDCLSSSNSANMTITYNDYYAPTGRVTNTKVRLSGSVTFTDNRRSTQNGLSYSSSGEQRVTATSMLRARLEITDSTGRVYGYDDTLSALTAYGSGSWDGWMRPSNGVTYSF